MSLEWLRARSAFRAGIGTAISLIIMVLSISRELPSALDPIWLELEQSGAHLAGDEVDPDRDRDAGRSP